MEKEKWKEIITNDVRRERKMGKVLKKMKSGGEEYEKLEKTGDLKRLQKKMPGATFISMYGHLETNF